MTTTPTPPTPTPPTPTPPTPAQPTTPTKPTRLEPPVTETTQPFWDATREQRLLLQWCTACEKPIHYPREVCPACLGSALEWRPASGNGSVYSFTVDHKMPNPDPDGGLLVVALVDLDEGVRVMSNIVGCEADDVAVGLPVAVAWEALSDGRYLPQFQPRT